MPVQANASQHAAPCRTLMSSGYPTAIQLKLGRDLKSAIRRLDSFTSVITTVGRPPVHICRQSKTKESVAVL